jgi:hypothetical protein
MATFKTNVTQILEIKASELDRDVLDILEGIIELTPADARDQMWLTRTKTLFETLNDDGLDEGYEDAFKEKWTAFVKRLDTLNAISPFKYVMILQNIDDTTDEKRIYKRYAIVKHIDDDGSETLEDYDNEETAREAFEAIRTNGYHVCEYEDRPDEKITFEEFDKVVFTMDIELSDERGGHEGFETMQFTPIVMIKGEVVSFSPTNKTRSSRYGWALADRMIAKENSGLNIPDEMYYELLCTYKTVMQSQGFEEYEFHYTDDIRNNPGTAIQHIRDVCKKAVEAGV